MKILIISITLCFMFGCNTAAPVAEKANSVPLTAKPEKAETAIAHSLENQTPNPGKPAVETTKWTQSGDPIDTKKLDAAIASAEAAFDKKPSDKDAEQALGTAFFKRAVALTEARQYASALGDYRRSLKHDPSNGEAQTWIDQIINIYAGLKKSYPKEGEEPPPLPFNKG